MVGEKKLIKQLAGKRQIEKRTPIATDMFLPNKSGIHENLKVKNSLFYRPSLTDGQAIKLDGTRFPGGRVNIDWVSDITGDRHARIGAHTNNDPAGAHNAWEVKTSDAAGTAMTTRFAIETGVDVANMEMASPVIINPNGDNQRSLTIDSDATTNPAVEITMDDPSYTALETNGIIDGVNVTSGADPGHTHTAYAATSHTMASHSDEDTYNISTTGTATVGALTCTIGGTTEASIIADNLYVGPTASTGLRWDEAAKVKFVVSGIEKGGFDGTGVYTLSRFDCSSLRCTTTAIGEAGTLSIGTNVGSTAGANTALLTTIGSGKTGPLVQTQTGWLKMFLGTTAIYIPYWTDA